MKIIIKKTYQELSKEAAEIIKEAILKKPSPVLGLATGSTPLGCYQELIRMHREEELDFSKVILDQAAASKLKGKYPAPTSGAGRG